MLLRGEVTNIAALLDRAALLGAAFNDASFAARWSGDVSNDEGVFRMAASDWPLIYHTLDDFTAPWRQPPAEVVLLHPGLGGNGELYRCWVPVLGDRFRVLRVDNRGQGRTSRPPGYQFSLDNFVADVVAVLDHHGIERVHWVGASGGGIIGQHAAITVPERIASLSLIATTARFRGPADWDAWLAPLDQGDVVAFMMGDLERRFGCDNPARAEWIVNQLARTPAATTAELHRWVRTVDLVPHLGCIGCPALIVTGECDTLTDLDDAGIMVRSIPRARLEVVRGLPHNIAYTHPRLVATLVRSFLDDLA